MGQTIRKSAAALLAFILAISLMLPYGALNSQVAWADDNTPASTDENISLVIKAGAATPTDASNTTFKFPNLTVESNSDRPIKSITVQFTSPITTDRIDLPTKDKFVQYSPVKAGNVSINVTDGASASEWQQYLRDNLQITLSNVNTTASIRMIASFDPVNATIDYNSLNGHYYKTVKGSRITWQDAYAAAQGSKYMGMQGYLVTVTSQEENNYVFSMIGEDCWTGATCLDEYTGAYSSEHDCAVKNIYKDFYETHGVPSIPASTMPNNAYYFWVDGPEKGQLISYGLTTSRKAAPDPTSDPDNPSPIFTYWNDGEPNNASGEQCMHFLKASGKWNDYVYNNASVTAYVIEYGGMESDDELEDSSEGSGDVDVDVFVKVDINIDPTGETITTEADDIYVGQPLAIKENVNGEYIQDQATGEYQVKTIVGRDADDNTKFLYENTTPTRTYYKLKDGGKVNRDDDWEELPAGELPTHVGTYKVVSNATFLQKYTDSVGDIHETRPYNAGTATFKIKKKSIDLTNPATPVNPGNPDATKDTVIMDVDPDDPSQTQEVSVSGRTYAKTYDGTTSFPGPGTINISDLVEPGAQAYLTYESAEYVSSDAGDRVDLVLHGVKIQGIDAADYSIAGIATDESGVSSLTVKGVITPRPLTVTTSYVDKNGSPVTSWTTGISTDPIEYTNNAQAYDAAIAVNGLPQNMLSPTDSESDNPNTIEDVLGEVTYTSMTRGGLELDTNDPQIGTYNLIPHFSKVSTKGGAQGFLTENGNYYVSFVNGQLSVKNRAIVNINDDTDGDGAPDPIVITTPVKPGKDDPTNPDNPTNPTNPGGSDDPADPSNPSQPGTPVDVEKIIEEELDKPVNPEDPDGPKKGDKVPEGVDPIITITKGGQEIEEIDPSEPGEYHIHVVYPDPEGTDTVLNIIYIIEPEKPSSDPDAAFFTVTTKLKGVTQGAYITPSQNVGKGKDATVTWSAGEDTYITMIEIDGKSVDVNAKEFTFSGIQSNHEVVVTLAEIPVIPASTTKGYYTIAVNKYGATQGLNISDSAVITKGDSYQITWSVEPGTTIKSVMIDGVSLSADQIAAGSYTFDKIAANHAVDIVAESATGSSALRQDDLQVTTQIVGGPGTITGSSTVSKGGDYAVAWQPVIQTTPDPDDPQYAVYEVESVKVNGKAMAGPDDRDLTLSNITENKNVVVTLKPVTYSVNIVKYGNGTASVSKTLYKGGRYIDISAQANSGSYISYVEVDGEVKYDASKIDGFVVPVKETTQLSVPNLLTASVQAAIAGEPLEFENGAPSDSNKTDANGVDNATGTVNNADSSSSNETSDQTNASGAGINANDGNDAAQQPDDNNGADVSTEMNAANDSIEQDGVSQVVPVLPELALQQDLSNTVDGNKDVANNALNVIEQSAQALTFADPQFESETLKDPEITDGNTVMSASVTGVAQNHKYIVYFTENGKDPITPDSLKDDDGNPPSTIETEVTGGPGTVEIIGDTVIPSKPSDPTDPDVPTPTKPTIKWDVPDDSVVTEIVIVDPDGNPIGTITPKPGEEQTGTAEIPDDILEKIKNNPGDYKVEIKTEKRVDGDEDKPKQRETKLSDGTQVTFEISTKLTGGPGMISATAEVLKGDSHTVTWEAGEQDGIKYRVVKVIIDGVERPDLVNATSYTFEDLAANHTIEVVVEPIDEETFESSGQETKGTSTASNDTNKTSSTTKTGDYTLFLVGGVVAVGALATIAMMYARRKMANKK